MIKFLNYFYNHATSVIIGIGDGDWSPPATLHSLFVTLSSHTAWERFGSSAPWCLCCDCSGPAEENENWASRTHQQEWTFTSRPLLLVLANDTFWDVKELRREGRAEGWKEKDEEEEREEKRRRRVQQKVVQITNSFILARGDQVWLLWSIKPGECCHLLAKHRRSGATFEA